MQTAVALGQARPPVPQPVPGGLLGLGEQPLVGAVAEPTEAKEDAPVGPCLVVPVGPRVGPLFDTVEVPLYRRRVLVVTKPVEQVKVAAAAPVHGPEPVRPLPPVHPTPRSPVLHHGPELARVTW